jgi:hypothetical protein
MRAMNRERNRKRGVHWIRFFWPEAKYEVLQRNHGRWTGWPFLALLPLLESRPQSSTTTSIGSTTTFLQTIFINLAELASYTTHFADIGAAPLSRPAPGLLAAAQRQAKKLWVSSGGSGNGRRSCPWQTPY